MRTSLAGLWGAREVVGVRLGVRLGWHLIELLTLLL